MTKLIQIPNNAKKFLSLEQEAVYTVWQNRANEYIVVINNAYDECKILETHASEAILKEKYSIELCKSTT